MEYGKVASRLREQIRIFSGELSKGLPKVSKQFVSERVYGIQASQSVVLTKIGRVLEEDISIKKTEERNSLVVLRGFMEVFCKVQPGQLEYLRRIMF